MANSDSISSLLDALVTDNTGLVGALVVGRDGVIIQSNLPANYSLDYLGAAGASLTALAETLLGYSNGGGLERLRLVGNQGQVLITSIADDVALLMISRRSVDADMVFESATNTAFALAQYL